MSAVLRIRRSLMLGGVLAALVAGSACERPQAVAAATPAHPWLNPPRVTDPKAVQLPPYLVFRVAAAARDEALAELEREPYIQISPAMAIHYAGQDLTVPMEMRPFLVRALGAEEDAIDVVQSLQGLWLRARSAGATPREQPLVVLLDPTPQEIFVTVEATAGAPGS